jgi:signal transduction histidine kinase
MPPPLATRDLALFRMAQEALNNTAKHARADVARLSLSVVDAQLELSLSDDGIGFDPAQPRLIATQLGMRTMRERVTAIGGNLEVIAATGRGVTIRARIPLETP